MIHRKAQAHREAASAEPLTFDTDICIGCNICVDLCQVDIMVPNPDEGAPPIVLFPGECWYDGSCVSACPLPGAISLNSIMANKVHCRRKQTGEDFYV